MPPDGPYAPGRRCLRCKRETDDQTYVGRTGKGPTDGAVSICLYCGKLAIFDGDEGKGYREPTPDEMLSIAFNPVIQKAKHAAASVMAKMHGASQN